MSNTAQASQHICQRVDQFIAERAELLASAKNDGAAWVETCEDGELLMAINDLDDLEMRQIASSPTPAEALFVRVGKIRGLKGASGICLEAFLQGAKARITKAFNDCPRVELVKD